MILALFNMTMVGSFSICGGDHYIKSLEVHHKKSGNLVKNNEFFNQHLPPAIKKIAPPATNHFNILSVGSCTGKTDFEIIKIVKQVLNKEDFQAKIFNRAVEPNGYSLSQYEEAVHEYYSSGNDPAMTKFELNRKTFQEYVETKSDEIKFDMIHFVHCIYYLDVKKTLMHCFEQELKEKGFIVCFVVGKDLLYECCKKQGHVWHAEDQTIECWITADDIANIADHYGWKCQVFNQEYSIDVNDVSDEESMEGNLLLDFLTYVQNFRKTADKKQVEETLDLIRELSTVEDGKLVGKRVDQLLILYK